MAPHVGPGAAWGQGQKLRHKGRVRRRFLHVRPVAPPGGEDHPLRRLGRAQAPAKESPVDEHFLGSKAFELVRQGHDLLRHGGPRQLHKAVGQGPQNRHLAEGRVDAGEGQYLPRHVAF